MPNERLTTDKLRELRDMAKASQRLITCAICGAYGVAENADAKLIRINGGWHYAHANCLAKFTGADLVTVRELTAAEIAERYGIKQPPTG